MSFNKTLSFLNKIIIFNIYTWKYDYYLLYIIIPIQYIISVENKERSRKEERSKETWKKQKREKEGEGKVIKHFKEFLPNSINGHPKIIHNFKFVTRLSEMCIIINFFSSFMQIIRLTCLEGYMLLSLLSFYRYRLVNCLFSHTCSRFV